LAKYLLWSFKLDVYNKLVFKYFFVTNWYIKFFWLQIGHLNHIHIYNVIYGSFNIKVASQKRLTTSNLNTYAHFIPFVVEFKPNLTNKYFINDIINQIIDNLVSNQDEITHI
jgi:hypothetical protein